MKKPNVANFARRMSEQIKIRVSRMSPGARIITGIALLVCGALGFLPVLGFWMIPLGLVVLSTEFQWADRAHKRWLRLFKRIQAWRRERRAASDKSKNPKHD